MLVVHMKARSSWGTPKSGSLLNKHGFLLLLMKSDCYLCPLSQPKHPFTKKPACITLLIRTASYLQHALPGKGQARSSGIQVTLTSTCKSTRTHRVPLISSGGMEPGNIFKCSFSNINWSGASQTPVTSARIHNVFIMVSAITMKGNAFIMAGHLK